MIKVNSLALRHTAGSRFSHFDGTWDELTALTEANFKHARPVPNREGVVLVPVPAYRFKAGVVEVEEETEIRAFVTRRSPDEDPYIDHVAVSAQKCPAGRVDIVLYSHEALGADATTDAEWEVVSINASADEGEQPPTPMSMARNFLGLPGGTKAEYSAKEFAEAIVYWSKHCHPRGMD